MVYINDQYKFIFVENPKSGSTSLLKALEQTLGIQIVRDAHVAIAHLTVDQIKQKWPEKWKVYLKVSSYRDPFKRFCSALNFNKHLTPQFHTDEEYLWHLKVPRKCPYCIPQHEFTKECDVLIRLDHMQEDFEALCTKLGIPLVEVPKANISRRKYKKNLNYEKLFEEYSKRLLSA